MISIGATVIASGHEGKVTALDLDKGTVTYAVGEDFVTVLYTDLRFDESTKTWVRD